MITLVSEEKYVILPVFERNGTHSNFDKLINKRKSSHWEEPKNNKHKVTFILDNRVFMEKLSDSCIHNFCVLRTNI